MAEMDKPAAPGTVEITHFCQKCGDVWRRTMPSGWRPIATAPKDGTQVLVWVQWSLPNQRMILIAWWRPRHSAYCDQEGEPLPASHWYPLPEPPK